MGSRRSARLASSLVPKVALTEPQPHFAVKKEPRANLAVKSPYFPRVKAEAGRGYDPTLFEEQWRLIERMREARDADVDIYGAEQITPSDGEVDPKTRRYQALISVMLSSQTRDPVTAAAMKRLQTAGLTINNIQAMSEEQVKDLIYGVGFHNRKAYYIKETTRILADQYDSDLPNDLATVVSLPGVGQKMAKIALRIAWNNICGISVDTHVHRVSRRIGWTSIKATTPEKTAAELEGWVPRHLWDSFNLVLVGFGQQICKPLMPSCDGCLINHICPKNGTRSKKV